MEDDQNLAPSGCFPLEALELLQEVEHAPLAHVYYHIRTTPNGAQLLALELNTKCNTTIVLGSDHDEPAVRVFKPQQWLEYVSQVYRDTSAPLHRHVANNLSLWQTLIHQNIREILLSRNEDGLALNDALVIDFGAEKRIVQISETAGLALGIFP